MTAEAEAGLSPEAEAVARVAEYRQWARLGEWVTYATGPLDRRNPVAALVRGWELQGLVELREEAGPEGQRWQQFSRLDADFRPGWNDALPPLAQPPSKRDLAKVDFASMAQWAAQGDERPEWLRYAASHYRDRLGKLGAALNEALRSARTKSVRLDRQELRDAEVLLSEAELVLLTFEQMLDPAPADAFPTPERLKVVRREITEAEKARNVAAGRAPLARRITMERARKESAAAAEVRRAVAEGVKRESAINSARKKHSASDGDVRARLAQGAALERGPADRTLGAAAELAGALQRGGLLEARALGLASELTGLAAADIRKALKKG